MNPPSRLYRRILVALDGSPNAERILPLVRPLLVTLEGTAVLTHVLSSGRGSPKAAARAYLRLVARKLESHGIDVETAAPTGDPAFEVLRTAETSEVDLIAMTTHGRGALARWALGSVAHKVLRASAYPVLLARSLGRRIAQVRQILVPLDGSLRAEAAVPHAAALARVYDAGILLFHVAPAPGIEARTSKFRRWVRAETARLEARLAALRATLAPLPVRMEIDKGDAALQIVMRSDPGTLIAMSSHGRTGIPRWTLGSVAEKVLHRTAAPMLIVKSFSTS